MTRNYLLFLDDISIRIDKINSYIDGMSFEEFVQDDKTVSACIREIDEEIVWNVATKKLPNIKKTRLNSNFVVVSIISPSLSIQHQTFS